jgi:heptosyltransferase-2
MHILLIRFSSMGDVVLQTATVNWLRALFGDKLRITFVTSKEFSSLIEGHPGINEVLSFDRKNGESWKSFTKKIGEIDNSHPFDLILDLHGTLRSFRLRLSLWRIPALSVDKRRWERFFLTKVKGRWFKRFISSRLGNEGQVKRIINDFEAIFNDHKGIRRTIEKVSGSSDELTSLPRIHKNVLNESYIVLAPSASFESKRWFVDRFVELAEKIIQQDFLTVVVLAGPDDHFCEAFNKINSPKLKNLQGKTSLKDSMSILSGASFCIGNDSGMNHIAEAFGVPCLTLFGPTDPCFGFSPHGKFSGSISKELWCKPCSTTGSKKCFRREHFCMQEISVEEVYNNFNSLRQKCLVG